MSATVLEAVRRKKAADPEGPKPALEEAREADKPEDTKPIPEPTPAPEEAEKGLSVSEFFKKYLRPSGLRAGFLYSVTPTANSVSVVQPSNLPQLGLNGTEGGDQLAYGFAAFLDIGEQEDFDRTSLGYRQLRFNSDRMVSDSTGTWKADQTTTIQSFEIGIRKGPFLSRDDPDKLGIFKPVFDWGSGWGLGLFGFYAGSGLARTCAETTVSHSNAEYSENRCSYAAFPFHLSVTGYPLYLLFPHGQLSLGLNAFAAPQAWGCLLNGDCTAEGAIHAFSAGSWEANVEARF